MYYLGEEQYDLLETAQVALFHADKPNERLSNPKDSALRQAVSAALARAVDLNHIDESAAAIASGTIKPKKKARKRAH